MAFSLCWETTTTIALGGSKKPSPWGGKPLSVEEWRIALKRANVHLLVNEAVRLEINGASLWLVGVDDPYTGRDNLKEALSEVPQNAFTILIAIPLT